MKSYDLKPYERIIFPLDFPSARKAMEYVYMLKGRVGMFKIGLELFIKAGPAIVDEVSRISGRPVFLDMKLHDIPETVARAVISAASLDISFLTFHPEEGADIGKRLPEDVRNKVKLLGVTLLTSSVGENTEEVCLKRARLAAANGASGIVCSPFEAKIIKQKMDITVVTPGIRPDWGCVANDDQKRVATPAFAIMMGADYIVVGRPVRDAGDPGEAADMIADEIEKEISDES